MEEVRNENMTRVVVLSPATMKLNVAHFSKKAKERWRIYLPKKKNVFLLFFFALFPVELAITVKMHRFNSAAATTGATTHRMAFSLSVSCCRPV